MPFCYIFSSNVRLCVVWLPGSRKDIFFPFLLFFLLSVKMRKKKSVKIYCMPDDFIERILCHDFWVFAEVVVWMRGENNGNFRPFAN
jgi:hypothetical protein